MKNKPKMEIDKFGITRWRLPNGDLHRENGPAVEYAYGHKEWWLNDKLHRKDGPAIEYADGEKQWYLNGKLHREDGPAIDYADGDKCWYLNDRLYKIQYNNKIIKRNKDFDCKTCISQIVCDYDCQEDIIWNEFFKKKIRKD